ncbi:MAG: hypothetical protein ACP5D3_01960, partial [Sulfurovum sp.]
TNQNDQVVAADQALLDLIGLQSVEELYQKVIKGELSFASLSPEDLTIVFGEHEEQQYTFHLQSSPLSSMLGALTLNILSASEFSEAPEKESVSLADEISLIERKEEPVALTETQKSSEDEDIIPLWDEDFLKEPEAEISIVQKPEAEEEASAFEPISILEEETELPAIETEEKAEIPAGEAAEAEEKSTAPIHIDVARVSETIGITPEEYNHFLNEFMDTAISQEKDLNSDDDKTQSTAIKTLVQLAEVLHLPELSKAAKEIESASAPERDSYVESFYNKLARITTQPSTLPDTKLPSIEPEISLGEEMIAAPETAPEQAPEEEGLPEGSFGTIDLGDVKAADELSLPVELVEEFVHDFIEQAKSETDNMLEAYRQGNLDKIQKIGHLLKGAASNLRINPLADTLYEIQFCEDSSKLEALIRSYWAHFIAFEKQMELTSK